MHRSERGRDHDSTEDEDSPLIPSPPAAVSSPTPSGKQILQVILLCASATLILDIGLTVVLAPKIRLFESILCQEYYRTHDLQGLIRDIPESQCKTKEIQSAVARLIGWQTVFDSLPAIFLAIPYGALSDTKGRRPVLLLCFLGLTLSTAWTLLVCWLQLPLELTWISSLFQCLGGGPAVATAVLEATIADVVPDDKRSTIYFQLQAAVLISDILANPLSSILMAHNVWIPCFLGLSIQALGTILLMALPETLSFARALLPPAESAHECEEEEQTLRGRLAKNFRSIVSDRNVAGLVFGLLVLTISAESVDFLLQYVSKRYGWSIAKSAMLLSLRAAVEFGLLLILGPLLLFLSWPSLRDPQQRDLWVARVSLGFIVLGFLILSLSPTVAPAILGLIIYTLGAGFQPAVMSLLASVWKASNPANLGSLYSTVAIILAAGGVIAGPLLSFMFQVGLRLGDAWVGLPYFVSACLCAGIALVMLSVRLPGRPSLSEM
ncbi:MFS transporter [Aspergillus homomorphus CBS 101889]|uniref:MFS general substrate transporter n=1 Tax=Aspergillus homomorphus (strain CBS 101889) TaxID=1450537 RepID=A0A395HFZ2_ASPHC|nr:MFS general substrate transporter [Aspergillus homomorphus CBS 101889]RAL06660.1 MFS general substrate transporter [Aspergillus homomorphus CBS 101889]